MAFQHQRWLHFKMWVQQHKKASGAIAVAAVLCISGSVALFMALHHKPKIPQVIKTVIEKPKPKPKRKTVCPLSGMPCTAAQAKRPITAIMIENSPDARPQSGMIQADVVFEAIAEAGITRFALLYQEGTPQIIGPVRSLRPYYLDWMTAFDASVAHVGGSARALSTVRNGHYIDLDQFFNPGSYWRSTDRYAPHNVYTSFAKLDALNKAKHHTSSKFSPFKRKADQPAKHPGARHIQVHISDDIYNSTYTYNRKGNDYLRSEGGTPHRDRETNIQIHPKTVAVMKVQETTVMEDGLRQSLIVQGDGEAWVFQDGTVTHGRWYKASPSGQLSFRDSKKQPIKLNAGQTWITAIPADQSVTWQS